MNGSNKFLGLTLALLIGVGGIYGCQSPVTSTKPTDSNVASTKPADTIIASNKPVQNNVASVKPVETTSSAKPSTSTTNKVASTSNSSELKEALIMESEDEKYFDDSDTSLSSTDKSFATKALEVGANLGANAGDRMVALNGNAAANAPKRQALKKQLKQFVSKNGAVKRAEDGTITIDTNKLKENLKKAKELAKEQVQKLRRKNNVVRTGDVEEVKNEDGTTTKTGTVAFENKKNGLKRNIVSVRNLTADGKLDTANYELTSEHKNFTRTVKRNVTVNEDGSKTIVFYSLTTFKDGRKREVNRTVNLDKDGNGTATGTIKITQKDGTEKTININSTISRKDGVITIAKDPSTGLEVKTEEKVDGNTTVTTTEEGKTSTEVVTEEKAEEVESAEPAPTTEASPAPEATATPAVEASAEASAS